jgi:phage terminase Nu1 subunit (DNA packaging protein)
MTDDVVNLDIPGARDVSRWDRRACPLLSVRGGGQIEVRDNVEIRHMAIVGMPLLHCLQ